MASGAVARAECLVVTLENAAVQRLMNHFHEIFELAFRELDSAIFWGIRIAQFEIPVRKSVALR